MALEPGESLEQALRREVAEELHVELHDLRPAFVVTAPAHGLPTATQLTMHCFHARPDGALRAGREIQDLAWLDDPSDPRAAPAVHEVLRLLTTNAT